jgi:hypothetical protein
MPAFLALFGNAIINLNHFVKDIMKTSRQKGSKIFD